MSEWFTQWFGKEYLDLYPHRDEKEARAVVDLIGGVVESECCTHALDLACGSGRHTRALCKHVWTVGLDLSMDLLQVARAEGPRVPYVRGDMRVLPFGNDSFDLVVNLFTSFGYFDRDDANLVVLSEVRRVLSAGGTFVLDYFNAAAVRRHLVPEDVRRVRGRLITQQRRITDDGKYVEKRISAVGSDHTYIERVRLFEPDDLTRIVTEAGFRIKNRFGDYTGTELLPDSPRTIFVAVKE